VLGGVQLLAAFAVRALVRQADAIVVQLDRGDGPDDDPRVIRGEIL
jgi:hypothetical protein